MIETKLYGDSLFGESLAPKPSGPVAERFLIPPFSVLDARSGDWQNRKRAWIGMGIKGETGRGMNLAYSQSDEWMSEHGVSKNNHLTYTGNAAKFDYSRVKEGKRKDTDESGTSIFDPTLCELVYRWFCPSGGQIVDPFAGGSVRGIVAFCLGLRYWGCDLRQEQIDANEIQAAELCQENRPVWVCGDAMEAVDNAPDADLVFSCPPYGDLEVYSDDPKDLSTMEWHTFVANYKRIILRACKKLKENRFACFVVGDFRDKKGYMRDFVSTTIAAFKECGLELYNESILITSVGSAAMRVTKQFNSGRKLCKVHQNVLVFCKGDWKKAADSCGKVEV